MSWFYPRLLKFKSDGSGAISPFWVPNFNGVNSYGTLLSTFTPTGTGTEITVSGVYKSDGSIQQLLAPDASTFNIRVSATNVISFDLLTNVTINGLPATSGSTVLADGYFVLTGILDASADIKTIGANAAFANNFQSQIHEVALDDPFDGVVNGRDVVEQNGVNSHGTVPAWSATNGVIEFYLSLIAGGKLQAIIDGYNASDSSLRVLVLATNKLEFYRCSLSVDGVPVTPGAFTLVVGKVYRLTLSSSQLVTTQPIAIAARYNKVDYSPCFISNLRLTDLDNPSNSRFYPMDTLTLEDTLGDGSTDGVWYNSPTLTYRNDNSLDIDMAISSEDMPTETSVYNKLDTTVYPELVTNGDFSDGLTGWTATNISGGSITNTDNALLLTTGINSYAGAHSSKFSLISGVRYLVSVDVKSISSSKNYNLILRGLGTQGFVSFNSIGTKSFIYKADTTGSTAYALIEGTSAQTKGATVLIDNISVKRTNKVGTLVNLGTTQPYVLKETE